MKKHLISGVLIGGTLGVITAWIAMSSAVEVGGLVALAGAFDGAMAGFGIGWLVGINVVEGAHDEAEDELAHVAKRREMAAAHQG